MKVLMSCDLLDLYKNGKCKIYKEVDRNNELILGFIRVVNTMILVNNVNELKSY